MAFRNGKATCVLCDTGGGGVIIARRVVFATVITQVPAGTDVSGPSNDNNLDTDLGDLSAGVFVDDYDIYLNGARQILAPSAAGNRDVYPGTSLVAGQIRFEKTLKIGDVIAVVDWAA